MMNHIRLTVIEETLQICRGFVLHSKFCSALVASLGRYLLSSKVRLSLFSPVPARVAVTAIARDMWSRERTEVTRNRWRSFQPMHRSGRIKLISEPTLCRLARRSCN